MRTRNANTPKTPASQKKPPSAKKSAVKTPTPPSLPVDSTPETSTPKSTASRNPEPQTTPSTADLNPEPAAENAVVSPTNKGTTKKVTKRIVKKRVIRPKTPASAKDGTSASVKTGEAGDSNVDVTDSTDAKAVNLSKSEEFVMKDLKLEELVTDKVPDGGEPHDKGKEKMDGIESPVVAIEDVSSAGNEDTSEPKEDKDDESKQDEAADPDKQAKDNLEKLVRDKSDSMDDDQKKENVNVHDMLKNRDSDKMDKTDEQAAESKQDEACATGGIEEYGDEEGFVEPGDEDLQEDDEPETGDEMKALEVEHKELAAAAKERKVKKELEIFVGGLDREVIEDDVKKTFEKVGEVVEVRLLKDTLTNKNRGFAFVRFATKDQAKRALSEMKNPVIRGKRCGTAPNEDNDTLFLGNVCNTWTKEAIKQKLKDYSVEGVENITLVQDPRHEGLSRGFCFIQFACHADAMFAYKRLQKPDAIFGHTERTAKVAFAEPLQEPDPEVMAKVKSVFVDGLPPHWDEDRVRKHFKVYGEIERITLARNMSSAKRKDFGFVDFTAHESAIACIEDVNSKELVDGNSKTKVRARLSNPLPKTQAVKGGMCGGFRIGRPSGRSFGRAAPALNRPNFQYGRPSRGQFNEPVGPYGRRVPYRAGHMAPGVGPAGRPNFGGPRDIGRGLARPVPSRREPFQLDDGGYSRPYMGRQYDDPYVYDDNHGLKRPFYMTDQDPAYMEPSRIRPRFDYSGSGRGTHFRDTYGAGSSFYSSGYYGPDYGARPHSSFNSRDRPYGGGHGYYY
ncbi:heterogeneous nuclear ribonucleoprotein Q-like [Chenopodium quinoa]|nr:heterogeneous nuclear ribonucleoprotein Q-like [Chenopodium quinoa]